MFYLDRLAINTNQYVIRKLSWELGRVGGKHQSKYVNITKMPIKILRHTHTFLLTLILFILFDCKYLVIYCYTTIKNSCLISRRINQTYINLFKKSFLLYWYRY